MGFCNYLKGGAEVCRDEDLDRASDETSTRLCLLYVFTE